MTITKVDKSVLSMETEGVAKTSLLSINKTIGGLEKSHKAVIIHSIPITGRHNIHKSLLEIVSISKEPMRSKWRIWFDGVPITREYKPNYVKELEDYELGITIIDVSPVVRRDLTRIKHKAIIINEGSEPIFLLSSMMTKIFSVRNAYSKISYYTGGFVLDNNEVVRIKSPVAGEEYMKKIYLVAFTEDYPSKINISCEEYIKEVNVASMVNEVSLNLDGCEKKEYVDLSVVAEHSMKPVIIPSVLFSVEKIQTPMLTLAIKDALKDNNKVSVSLEIKNKGRMTADEIMLTLLALGSPIYRKKINSLGPGENVTITETVKFPGEARILVARIIWNELGEPRFIEKKVKF